MRKISLDELSLFDPRALGDGSLPTVSLYVTEPGDCRLPRRKEDGHKYEFGRALILAGKRGYSGAAWLAANACEKSGAGLTTLMVPESIYEIAALRCCGTVVQPLPADAEGGFSEDAVRAALDSLQSAGVCLIGPGLGRGRGAEALVMAVLKAATCPVILDADGINILSGHIDEMDSTAYPLLLTPHEGEFRRLGGSTASGRINGLVDFLQNHRARIILKGHRSLIAENGSSITVNPTGGPAMAKGGSGDVLAGMLAGLLAQGLPWDLAARAAVYLHGLCGDLAAAELGEYSVTPDDLLRYLPAAFKSVLSE